MVEKELQFWLRQNLILFQPNLNIKEGMRLSMKDEKGVALPTLLFIILLIIIVAVFAIKYVKRNVK